MDTKLNMIIYSGPLLVPDVVFSAEPKKIGSFSLSIPDENRFVSTCGTSRSGDGRHFVKRGIYNQELQGTILWMVFDFLGFPLKREGPKFEDIGCLIIG